MAELDKVNNDKIGIGVEIMKAINEIREKKKRPCEDTIMAFFEKKSIGVQRESVASALTRLEEAKLIENRMKNGDDSYFVLDSRKIEEEAEIRFISCNDAGKFTPYLEFLNLQKTVESLKIAVEEKIESKGQPMGIHTERILREETAQLKNENESLKNELKRKELILQSIQNRETSKPKLPRSIWSDEDDDDDSISDKNPANSKEVKFRYPHRKHIVKTKKRGITYPK